MQPLTRRRLILAGAAAVATPAAATLAARQGLIPPDAVGPFAPGNALNYAAHRVLTGDAPARQFRRDQITKPFANGPAPDDPAYVAHRAAAFTDWRLEITGLVTRPVSLSVAGLAARPASSHITSLTCEEGWSYIAEWAGVPLAALLEDAGLSPEATHIVFHCHQPDWWDSLDLAEALHPQTLIAHGMNGAALPPDHGGPLRLRVPRQLGYKNLKYLTRITATNNLKQFGQGLGSASPEAGYAWHAAI